MVVLPTLDGPISSRTRPGEVGAVPTKPEQTCIWLGCAALDARASSITSVLRMEQGVVVSAVELEVAQFGRAAVRPVPYVARLTALWRPRAARRLAVAIAQLQGLVHARGQRPCAVAHVQGFPVGVHDHRGDGRVAGDAAGALAGDQRPPVQLS